MIIKVKYEINGLTYHPHLGFYDILESVRDHLRSYGRIIKEDIERNPSIFVVEYEETKDRDFSAYEIKEAVNETEANLTSYGTVYSERIT